MKYSQLSRIVLISVLCSFTSVSNAADSAVINKLDNPVVTVAPVAQGQPKININTGDITSLISLPGIGKVKAQAVVNYRQKNGLFKNLQDLKKVKGFSPFLVNQLKDKISL